MTGEEQVSKMNTTTRLKTFTYLLRFWKLFGIYAFEVNHSMKRFFSSRNLRNKLMITLVVFILTPLILIGYIFYERSNQYILDRTDRETYQVLNLVRQNVDQLLQEIENQLLSLYDQEEVIGELSRLYSTSNIMQIEQNQESINQYLRTFLLGKDQVDSVYMIPSGSAVYFADFKGSSFFLEQLSKRPEWRSQLQAADGKVVWFPTYGLAPNRFLSQPQYYIPVGMQVKDVTDVLQPLGTIMLNVKIEALDRIIGPVSVSPNSVFMVTDSQGQVVWHHHSEIYGTNIRDETFYQEAVRHLGKFTTQRLNGELYRIGVTQSDYNGWYYFSFLPIRDLEAQSENMKSFLVLTIVAFTALFVLLAWLTTHFITKPIRQMVAAMKLIHKNNLGIRLQTQSIDEIGLLQSAFNGMQDRINDLIYEVRVKSEKEREAEVRALQAQINPHVLYNTLDTINWMAIERGQKDISEMITALSDIMRYAIRQKNKLVTLKEEINWAENYSYLQKMRFEDRFDISFDIDLDIVEHKVPRLFMQPYLENAIIHGMEHTESGGLIRITARSNEQGHIEVVIADNGCGISQEKLRAIKRKETHGMGIYNLDERLQLEYGRPFGVTVESELNKGTTITITLPKLK